MGVVYAAVHEKLGRPVALKVLRRELSTNTELSGRFQREAELVTRIGHPNIVAVYDFGRLADGSLYYVMEKIQGESLGTRLRRERLSDQQIVEVFGPLLSALRAAHEIGVVHRDLKPDAERAEGGAGAIDAQTAAPRRALDANETQRKAAVWQGGNSTAVPR